MFQISLRMNCLVDVTHNAIVSISDKGRLLSFNHAAERLFQYSESELMGLNVTVLMPADHDEH